MPRTLGTLPLTTRHPVGIRGDGTDSPDRVHGWSSPAVLDLPSAVYDVYLGFYGQPWQSEAGAVSFGVTPGLYGDFGRVDRETFQWSGWLLASRHLGLRWTVLGGVAYVRQLRANWLPIGGAIWIPSDTTRFEVLFPRPKVTHRFYTDGNWSHWAYIVVTMEKPKH